MVGLDSTVKSNLGGTMEGELCGLRAGLSLVEDKSFMPEVRKLYPPRSWTGMQKVGEGKLNDNYNTVFADKQWYGCQVPEQFKERMNSGIKIRELQSADEAITTNLKQAIEQYRSTVDLKKAARESLEENWAAFEKHAVVNTDIEIVKKDEDNILYIHPQVKEQLMNELSEMNHEWNEEPWLALERAAALDISNGAEASSVVKFLALAHKVISMGFCAGKYKAEAVAAKDELTGERIVLASLLIGQEQIKLGYDQFWVKQCPNLRVMTYRATCGAYSRGVIKGGECTLMQVFNAGGSTPPMDGNVKWSRVRAAYVDLMPRQLGDVVEKKMKEARSVFVYPTHSGRDIVEMNAWCDVTTFDWYALCGPSSDEVSPAAVGALMLGYECEVLVDMCPKVTYEDYMAFIAAGVDVIPHMDTKELVAGAFAAHACGVAGFPGLHWLQKAIDEHTKKGGSMWGPRSVDGAAYLMFQGINEACRQPSIHYGEVRMKAEVNLMASHEVAGLFRHGMEGDAISRAMLDSDAHIASFPKMIDYLANNAPLIGMDMGPPHSTGFMLTGFGYLLFNLIGSSSMLRWASGAKPRCDSIAVYADKDENVKLPSKTPEEEEKDKKRANDNMTRDMMKVSSLAAHRALRLGIDTDYVETHKHVEGGDCVCWNCIAGEDRKCTACGRS